MKFYIQHISEGGYTLIAVDENGNAVKRVEYRYDPIEDGGVRIDFLHELEDCFRLEGYSVKEISRKQAEELGAKGYEKIEKTPVFVEGRPARKETFMGRSWWVKSIKEVKNISCLNR